MRPVRRAGWVWGRVEGPKPKSLPGSPGTTSLTRVGLADPRSRLWRRGALIEIRLSTKKWAIPFLEEPRLKLELEPQYSTNLKKGNSSCCFHERMTAKVFSRAVPAKLLIEMPDYQGRTVRP